MKHSPPPNPGATAPRALPPVGLRVLLVDDLRPTQQGLARTLAGIGCHTTVANDVRRAFELARYRAFDIALIDCAVPNPADDDPVHGLRQIAAALGRSIHVIALCGTAASEETVSALRRQADLALRKPLRPVVLERHLRLLARRPSLKSPIPLPRHRATTHHDAHQGVRKEQRAARPLRLILAHVHRHAWVQARSTLRYLLPSIVKDIMCVADRQGLQERLGDGAVDLVVGDSSLLCAHVREASKSLPPWIALASTLDEADQAMASGAADFHLHPLDWAVVARRIHRLAQLRLHLEATERYRERLLALQRVARVGEWTLDLARGTFQLSSQSRQLLGLGGQTDALYSQVELLRRVHPSDREQCARTLRAAAEQATAQHCEFRATEGSLWLSFHAVPVRVGEVTVRLRGTLQDISAQRAQQAEVRRLAYYDDVTGLPNRRRFRERLGRALDRAASDHGELAVLFIDLDEFKRINDTLGHTFGDMLLKQVAERLSAVVRESDAISRDALEAPRGDLNEVARMGGDEFVIMLTGLKDGQEAAGVASRIVNVLNRPIVIDGHDMRVTPSIGIALYPRDGKDAEALLRCADTAMYHAKSRGRNRFEYFSTELGERALRRLTLEGRLRVALDTNQFSLVYQPKVALSSDRCVAVEAFLRWEQGEQRPISPDEFLPVAESSGLIIEIGEWVIAEVLRQLDQWDSEGLAVPRIILNTSVTQLNRGKFCDVLSYVSEPKGRLQRLELDVTEHALMSMSDTVISELATLRERGLRIAVDDFGTGYSSLQNLRRLPLDALKIDRSFVDGLPHETGDRAIVGAIISMGQQLGLEVVAEGVGRVEQRAWLEEKGCDTAQGDLIAPPMAAHALSAFLVQTVARTEVDAG